MFVPTRLDDILEISMNNSSVSLISLTLLSKSCSPDEKTLVTYSMASSKSIVLSSGLTTFFSSSPESSPDSSEELDVSSPPS
jgi:hypothetical protein